MAPTRRVPKKKEAAKASVDVNASSSNPLPQVSPGVMVHWEDPLAWLKGEPLPANWTRFAPREVVAEKGFSLFHICQNSLHGKLQLPNALTLLERQKHVKQYMNSEYTAFPSLTRLFYSSLTVSSDGDAIHGHIGKFQFSFTMKDIVALYENDQTFLQTATPVLTEEFIETVPDQNELIQTFFIVPSKKPHALNSHIDILYSMVIHSNILPSKGNKSELTRRMIDLLWILNHHTPCLAHLIFHNIKCVLGNKKPVALPYPSLITQLLEKKGYLSPDVHEPGWTKEVVDSKTWDRSLNAGKDTRMEAFASRGWKNTEGMVVGGTILPDNHPDNQSRKRRAVQLIVSPTAEAGSSSAANMVISSRIESSLATLANLVTNMNVSITSRLDKMDANYTDLKTYMETSMDALKADVKTIKRDVKELYESDTEVPPSQEAAQNVEQDNDEDDANAPLFDINTLVGERSRKKQPCGTQILKSHD